MAIPVLGVAVGALLALLAAALTGRLLAQAGFPLPSGEKRAGHIDGLRGFLALSVMVHHFTVWMQVARLGGAWSAPSVNFFAQLGAGGVALFFMTTGLLFYPRIVAGFAASSWPAVFVSRVCRLVPLSVFSFALVTLVVMFQTGRGLDADFPAAALQWIFAADEPPLLGFADSGRVNAYVLWSLKYEWQFYLFALPLSALAMESLRKKKLPSWIFPVALILGAALARRIFPAIGLLKFLPMFATGMLAFEAQNRPAVARWLRSPPATLIAIGAMAAALTLFRSPYDLAWPLFAFFFFAVAGGNSIGGLLKTKAALVLGECSYGIYLMHGIVLYVLFIDGGAVTDLFATPLLPVLMPLAALAIVLLTAAAHLCVERPGMAAGRRLAERFRSLSARRVSFGESVSP